MAANNEDALDHAWRYFELHAKQRMTVFNFFIVAAGAAFTGIGVALQQGPHFAALGVLVGILLVLVAFIFWKLDGRSSHLVKLAENSLAQLEVDLPEAARLITRERLDCSTSRCGMWTFGQAFRLTFLCVAVVGVVGGGLSLASGFGWVSLASDSATPQRSMNHSVAISLPRPADAVPTQP